MWESEKKKKNLLCYTTIIDLSGTTCYSDNLNKEDKLTLKYRQLAVKELESGVRDLESETIYEDPLVFFQDPSRSTDVTGVADYSDPKRVHTGSAA